MVFHYTLSWAILWCMILSDRDIKKAIKSGRIRIRPKPDWGVQLGSCMIDLQLGNVYRVFNHSKTPYLDPQNPKTLSDVTTEIRVKDGDVVHSTAANIECGFRGNITLELANMGRIPVMLYPGMRICSLSFEQLTSPAEVPYYKKKGAKYVGQKKPEASKIAQEK
ncbi:MAG: Deoxycytidine triphosphate deaminase [Microgenomates group bacterium GW2011_GWA2_46_7]|nr:MAG: Deoxycytidine triphosphate deaminase [Microgenomates group bacterium GW2011_GWA2_46_7]